MDDFTEGYLDLLSIVDTQFKITIEKFNKDKPILYSVYAHDNCDSRKHRTHVHDIDADIVWMKNMVRLGSDNGLKVKVVKIEGDFDCGKKIYFVISHGKK